MINELKFSENNGEIKQYSYRKFKTQESRNKYMERINNWRKNNKEYTNELSRLSYHKHKHKHIEYKKYWNIYKKYGITKEEYQDLLLSQENKCFICGRNMIDDTKPCVDHDHINNKVRGILCIKCNADLGWYELYKDNILKYLNKNNKYVN